MQENINLIVMKTVGENYLLSNKKIKRGVWLATIGSTLLFVIFRCSTVRFGLLR